MIELIIAIVVFLLLILIVIWGHFLRSNQANFKLVENLRDETNVSLYHEHKAEIERDYKEGGIDDENYQYLLGELEKSLLQDIEQNSDENADVTKTTRVKTKTLSIIWPVLISVFVFVFSFTFYQKSGGYEQVTKAASATKEQAHQLNEETEQLKVRIQTLQAAIEKNPQSADNWYEMGQVLVGAGDFDNAIKAFERVIIIEGEHADVYGAIAQAHYYKNNQMINPTVQNYIDKALAIDPIDPSTNILLGMHNFINKDYQQAITYWQRVVDSGRENVNIEALKEALNEAKNRLSLSGTAPMAPKNNAEPSNSPQLTVNVAMTDAIAEKLSQSEDKTVFVYAVPVNGGRMPVAAVKILASDLPTTLVLNNASAMSPQANLSSVESVNIFAVVSQEGGAGINKGDFKGEQQQISVDTLTPIDLVIDLIVPE